MHIMRESFIALVLWSNAKTEVSKFKNKNGDVDVSLTIEKTTTTKLVGFFTK